MESIGNVLQNERVNKGISLAEAHEATKITVQNLTALEEDRFESFPNRVYARAFLRDYANYLRLDSAELLERYESEWGPKSRMEPARKGSRLPVAAISLVILLLAAIAAGAYYLSQQQQKRPKASVTTKRTGQTSSKPEQKPTTKPVKSETQAAVPTVVPAPVEELKLQITATTGSWIKVVADNQTPVVLMLASGEVKSFTAKDKFTVRLGRPHGVRLHMNGQLLPPLGQAGTSVTKELDRSWLKPAPGNPGASANVVPGVPPSGTNPPEGTPQPTTPAPAGNNSAGNTPQ